MEIIDLAKFGADTVFNAELIIVGGGPAGLTIAREFIGAPIRVLVLESGLINETPAHAALSELESVGEPSTAAQKRTRNTVHGPSSFMWSPELQPFGVRSRALGGATHVWAGKCAAFDRIDFAKRPWVPNSGWPIARDALDAYIDRAAHVLNLGPNVYDTRLWDWIGAPRSVRWLDSEGLRSFFWQFARSRLDRPDIMRFGQEFASLKAKNIRVLVNATVTRIGLTEDGTSFDHVEMSTLLGARHRAEGRSAVIAGSTIENARLLLASNDVQPGGIGNSRDMVGRFLMDHAVARVGTFKPDDIPSIMRRFGLYGVRHSGRTHMYMHGLAPTPDVQEREHLLNCAVYFTPDRSPDNPWDALKRLIRGKNSYPLRDLYFLISGGALVAKGVSMKAFSSHVMPDLLKRLIVDTTYFPNFVVDAFQSQGLPHKLSAVWMEIISEQRPDPDSRVTLSNRTDRLGVPLPKVDWHINDDERRTIVRVSQMTRRLFARAGLPEPILEAWVNREMLQDAEIIDFAHTSGTTRMSRDPRSGVVDADCQVHGVRGLYIAGASTFPTNGHANPTLMILALAIRVADKIKAEFSRLPTVSAQGAHY
jgi:choline dehydrogenase-like flavoprotein